MPPEVLDGLSVARRTDTWRQALAQRDGPTVYVGVEDGNVAGFCAVATPSRDNDAEADVAEVTAIYVDPDDWSKGLGRAMMAAALADLEQGGWRWLTLWVLADNDRACRFYEELGFLPEGAETIHERSGRREVRWRRSVIA